MARFSLSNKKVVGQSFHSTVMIVGIEMNDGEWCFYSRKQS